MVAKHSVHAVLTPKSVQEPTYLDEDEDTGDWYWNQDEDMFPTRTSVSFDFTVTKYVNVPGWRKDATGHHDAAYDDHRLYAGCLNCCFCSWGVDDLTIQPKREVPSNADLITVQSDGYPFYELKLEFADFGRGDTILYSRV